MKKYRSTPEYKAKRAAYIAKNKNKIQEQEKITKSRYSEKNKNEVSDAYVINKLVQQGYGTKEEIMNNPELIGIKRVQILSRRIKNIIHATKH
jgi:thermostable 8-oxoguanine DNA glycosylase